MSLETDFNGSKMSLIMIWAIIYFWGLTFITTTVLSANDSHIYVCYDRRCVVSEEAQKYYRRHLRLEKDKIVSENMKTVPRLKA